MALQGFRADEGIFPFVQNKKRASGLRRRGRSGTRGSEGAIDITAALPRTSLRRRGIRRSPRRAAKPITLHRIVEQSKGPGFYYKEEGISIISAEDPYGHSDI